MTASLQSVRTALHSWQIWNGAAVVSSQSTGFNDALPGQERVERKARDQDAVYELDDAAEHEEEEKGVDEL